MEQIKQKLLYLVVTGICAIALGAGYIANRAATSSEVQRVDPSALLAGHTLQILLANTPLLRQQGLSGRVGLDTDEGMLFIFDEEGEYSFWMKDMLFSIDIVWIDEDGTIVDIAQSVSPDTYPESFKPSAPARYVLELRAGWTKQNNVRIGDKIHLYK